MEIQSPFKIDLLVWKYNQVEIQSPFKIPLLVYAIFVWIYNQLDTNEIIFIKCKMFMFLCFWALKGELKYLLFFMICTWHPFHFLFKFKLLSHKPLNVYSFSIFIFDNMLLKESKWNTMNGIYFNVVFKSIIETRSEWNDNPFDYWYKNIRKENIQLMIHNNKRE